MFRIYPWGVLWISTLIVSNFGPGHQGLVLAGPAESMEPMGPSDSLDMHELDDEEDDPFYQEWHEKMIDFHPQSILSFDISPRSTETFYENVMKQEQTIRGMFFTLSKEEALDIELFVRSPIGELIYHKESSDGIFLVEAKMPGEYEFALTNNHWITPVGVTFAVGSGEHSVLQSQHIKNTSARLQKLKDHVDSIYAQFKHIWLHNHRQMKTSRGVQRSLLIYAIVQFAIICICSLVCITYVKRIVSKRRIL